MWRSGAIVALALLGILGREGHAQDPESEAPSTGRRRQRQRHRRNTEHAEAPDRRANAFDLSVCPLTGVDERARGLAVGEDEALAELVDSLVGNELGCYEECIRGVRDHAAQNASELEAAQAGCRACVELEAETQRQAVLLAMDADHNPGCRVPPPGEDRCFIAVQRGYRIVHTPGEEAAEAAGAASPRQDFHGGWYALPKKLRTRSSAYNVYPGSCRKDCMPSDGIGSVFSFVFALYAAAMESGCSLVFAEPMRLAHGMKAVEAEDFFRASSRCLAGDHHAALSSLHQVIVGGTEESREILAREAVEEPATVGSKGTAYYVARDLIAGGAGHHAFRLGQLRGGMHVCGRRHAGVLARLALRAKFETGQDRRMQLRGSVTTPPDFVLAHAAKPSNTQVAAGAWFDAVAPPGPDGRLPLNVVMHVRRGDVNVHRAEFAGGVYAAHFIPTEIVTAGLEALVEAWAPLAGKLGVRLNVFVASEGDITDFPEAAWRGILGDLGDLHWKLKPYAGQKDSADARRQAHADNTTTALTIGQMMDADVLLGDGRSLFSLTANAWAVNTLFLTYPWLLNLGAPLEETIARKAGDVDAPMPPHHPYPVHPLYEELGTNNTQGGKHPGVHLLDRAHYAAEFRGELELLYKHRQTAFLQGMLANVVAKKRRAIERGAHFNWMGY